MQDYFGCCQNGGCTENDNLRSNVWRTLPSDSVLAMLAFPPLPQRNMLGSLSPEMRLGQDPDLLAKSRRRNTANSCEEGIHTYLHHTGEAVV